MKSFVTTSLLALTLIGPAVYASDSETSPNVHAADHDYAAGKQAVARKDWPAAVASFRKVVAADPNNADGYNMLGYSLRSMGKIDEALAAYDRALAINPKHMGALEYSGVAYLKAGQPAKAKEQLAKLEALGGKSSEEYRDLQEAIEKYDAGQH